MENEEVTPDDLEVRFILSLSFSALFDYVMNHPEYLTDGYYRMYGAAIDKRYEELS